jgi:hypothetical protein
MSFEKLYPKIPTAPNDNEQSIFIKNTLNSKLDDLKKFKDKFNTKHEKYNKIINRLMILNATASTISVSSGITSITSAATLIGIPISIGLGGLALVGSISTGIITVLIKKYQKKIDRVIKLHDIVTNGTAIFENTISKTLKDQNIDSNEFEMLQNIYYQTLENLSISDKKLRTETRDQFEKNLLVEMQNIKKSLHVNAS